MRSATLSILESYRDMQPEAKVFGVSGSPRLGGNSDILLEQLIAGAAREHLPAEHLNLTSLQFQGCIGCERCRKDKICTGLLDGMSAIYGELVSAKGLVLVSPTHNYNVTSWVKAFIDRLYCFYRFENDRPRSWTSNLAQQGRKAVIAAICEQESKVDMGITLEAMRMPLEALGYEIVGELPVMGIFDKSRVAKYEQVLLNAQELGGRLARSLIS